MDKDKGEPRCSNCGRTGHWSAECRKKRSLEAPSEERGRLRAEAYPRRVRIRESADETGELHHTEDLLGDITWVGEEPCRPSEPQLKLVSGGDEEQTRSNFEERSGTRTLQRAKNEVKAELTEGLNVASNVNWGLQGSE